MSPITQEQWSKVLKALYYSFGSGFVGGLTLTLTSVFANILNGTESNITFNKALIVALVVGGVVGGFNSLAVTIKQLFTPPTSESK